MAGEFEFRITSTYIRFTPVSIIVDPDDYVITESDPVQTSWRHTTANPVNITINDGDITTVEFGNLCLGPGGGLTLGFWSNKNGEKTMNDGGTVAPELALLTRVEPSQCYRRQLRSRKLHPIPNLDTERELQPTWLTCSQPNWQRWC